MSVATAADRLEQLAEEVRRATVEWDPLYCSEIGMSGGAAAVPDFSEQAREALAARFSRVAGEVVRIDSAELVGHDRHTREMLVWHSSLWERICRSARDEWSLSPYKAFSLPTAVTSILPKARLTTAQEAEDFAARCAGMPHALQTSMQALRRGERHGRAPVRRLVAETIELLDRLADSGGAEAALRAIPVTDEVRGGVAEWRAALSRTLREGLDPMLRHYREFLSAQVLVRSRSDEECGVCWVPGGEESYQLSLSEYTTTGMTAHELHELGVETVAVLADEVRPVAQRMFGHEDLGLLAMRLREDPQLRFPDSDAVVEAARQALERGEQALGALISHSPQQPCGVRAMPALEAARMMPAYYRPGSSDGSRPSLFWINTHGNKAARRYEIDTLAVHESVPGHHVQFSLAREIGPQSRYRREFPNMAFVEGWAVYCESLADSLGLLTSDTSRLGSWSALSWRASRLVVDTGLHAKGWSRRQAVDYLVQHSALSQATAEGEVDRYIGNPGQALAYMTGRLRVQAARDRAERRLGAAFDARRFHDVLLAQGCPTLDVMDTVVDEWADAMEKTGHGVVPDDRNE